MLLPGVAAAEPALSFEYTLDNRYQTSAGVYDTGGRLVRTLWSNRTREEGTHTDTWDGLDDDGQPWSGAGEVAVKLLAHNVNYRWEGVIGNTSRDQTSPMKLDYQYFMQDFAVSGGRIYTLRFAEGAVPRVRWHRTDDLNADWAARPGRENLRGGFGFFSRLAVDEDRVYAARAGFDREDPSGGMHAAFIIALDRNLEREIVFPQGREFCTTGGTPWRGMEDCYRDGRVSARFASAIDVVDRHRGEEVRRNDVTGLAVQRGGRLLFAARGGIDVLHVLDKQTGALLQQNALPGAGDLAVCRSADHEAASTVLWAIHALGQGQKARRVVSRFIVDPVAGRVDPVPALTLPEDMQPLNLAVSPDCTEIAVIAGGARQQVLGFDAASGVRTWVLGDEGGYYTNGPTVTPTRFSFTEEVDPETGAVKESGHVDYADNGDLFVGDPGLTRVQRFDHGRRVVDAALWVPINYSVRVDENDPSRVFRVFHEYEVDWSRPLNEAWKLVRYYGDGLPRGRHWLLEGHVTSGFGSLATLSNGRSYGLAYNPARRQNEVIEVPKDGPLRLTGVRLPPFHFLEADGSVTSLRYGRVGEHLVAFTRRALEDIDARGNPRWSRPEVVARAERTARSPRVVTAFGKTFGRTEGGLQAWFDPQQGGPDYFRLAAVEEGEAAAPVWQTSRSVGRFDLAEPDGRFDASDLWYAGHAMDVHGSDLVYNFHGEAWSDGITPPGQANQYLHFHESGLFVGQFGTPRVFDVPPSAPGGAGNGFGFQLITAADEAFVLHGDEHAHSGVHVWRLAGADTLRLWQGRGRASGPGVLVLEPDGNQGVVPLPPGPRLRATAERGSVDLAWTDAPGDAVGFEIERLETTYTGRRFGLLSTLPAGARRSRDAAPELGYTGVYRLRALTTDGPSDWSNHATVKLATRRELLYAQDFEGAEWQAEPLPYQACIGKGPAGERCGLADMPGSGRGLQVLTPTTEGQRVWNRRFWHIPALLAPLNAAMARSRGSTPEQFEIRFDYSLSPVAAADTTRVWVEIGPGGDIHTFARLGGLVVLPVSPDRVEGTGLARGTVTRILTALPNGRPSDGLVHWENDRAPLASAVLGFQGTGAAGDPTIDLRVDNLRVSRIVAP